MKQKKVILVGWVRTGQPATCGETMKNQQLIQQLQKYYNDICVMDFYGWRKRPWVVLQLLWTLLVNPKAPLILSSSPQNIYPIMKLMYFVKSKRTIIHWVIGGSLHTKTKTGIYKSKYIGYNTYNLVESNTMMEELKQCGVNNVLQVPNFKQIDYIPNRLPKENKIIRFVFLSRIMPEKGCDLIIEAANKLNAEGYANKYTVDFYGKIDDAYSEEFTRKLNSLENVNYKGFLNLREHTGYDELAKYDVMLFPTFWRGEGFAGIFIDAFVAGLPIIISDWNHNKEFIKDGETGIVILPQNVTELANAMRNVIDKKVDIEKMSKNCQAEAMNYNTDSVVTKELLEKIELI